MCRVAAGRAGCRVAAWRAA